MNVGIDGIMMIWLQHVPLSHLRLLSGDSQLLKHKREEPSFELKKYISASVKQHFIFHINL